MPSPRLVKSLSEALLGAPRKFDRLSPGGGTGVYRVAEGVDVPAHPDADPGEYGEAMRFFDKQNAKAIENADEVDPSELGEGDEIADLFPDALKWYQVNKQMDIPHPDSRKLPEEGVDGEYLSLATPREMDRVFYGVSEGDDIRQRMLARAEGGMYRGEDMPSGFPDEKDPLYHYDNPVLVRDSRFVSGPDANYDFYTSDTRQIALNPDSRDPYGAARHEFGHAGTITSDSLFAPRWGDNPDEVAGDLRTALLDAQKSSTDSATDSSDVFRPHFEKRLGFLSDAHEADYIRLPKEMLSYLRDFKMQNYYGLLDENGQRVVQPSMPRRKFSNLKDELLAEAQEFHGLMDKYKTADYGRQFSIDDEGRKIAEIYFTLDGPGRDRLAKAFALLGISPLVLAGQEDGSESAGAGLQY